MTIPRRADLASGVIGAEGRQRLLAELPHVGEHLRSAAESPSTQSSRRIAAVEYENIELAEVTQLDSCARNTRFVDQAHIDEQGDIRRCATADFDVRQSHNISSQSLIHRQRPHSSPRPKSASGALLARIHERAASFAGLIVTAALIAAASLLVHMMSVQNKSSAEFNEFALPGFRVEAIDEELETEQTPPLADVSQAPELSPPSDLPAEPAALDPPHNEGKTLPAIDTRAHDASVPALDGASQTSGTLGQLSFPQTSTPSALDYAKAADPDLQQLPAVAERPDTSTEGINR